MLTESSKPTMAKKASVVAPITAQNAPRSGAVWNSVTRETSPSPAPIAHRPMTMMMSRPGELDAGQDDVRLHAFADAAKIDDRHDRHEGEADQRDASVAKSRPKAVERFAAKAREAVEAEVMPEHITAKATMKVTKWMPKALCA